jgi:LytR cell envelope-related transcriptional attenuator
MDIIEQIGAYGGLAAVLGLAVLSALYFSQARDVKRLREWAGRAPERVAEGAAADQLARGVVAQPQPKVVQEAQGASPAVPGAKPATPAAKPVSAPAAAAAGAGPATADQKVGPPKPATPAAAPSTAEADLETAAKEADKEPEKVGAAAATPAGAAAAAGVGAGAAGTTGQAATAAPAKPGADGTTPSQPGSSPAQPGGGPPPAQPGVPAGQPPRPPGAPAPPGAPGAPAARPGAPQRPGARPTIPLPSQRGAPAPSQTAILPPRSAEQPWYRHILGSPRYLVLAIAGVLIVGGGAAFGVVELTSDDEGGGSAGERALGGGSGGGGSEGGQQPATPVNPGDVTVSVLNGTTIPGLAASIGDRVEANGFVLGNVDNSADQGARNESVVLFAPGAEREAVAVGRRLGIAQREPIDAESRAIAGDASVVVITGTDLTQ